MHVSLELEGKALHAREKKGAGVGVEKEFNSLKVCTHNVREGSETYSVRIRGQGGRAGGYAYCKYYTAVRAGMCKKGRGVGGDGKGEKRRRKCSTRRGRMFRAEGSVAD